MPISSQRVKVVYVLMYSPQKTPTSLDLSMMIQKFWWILYEKYVILTYTAFAGIT